MRSSDKERKRTLQQLRELNNRDEFVDFSSETKNFPARIEEEIQWIKANKILGTWGGKGQDIQYDKKVFGARCKAARKECRYSEVAVAKHLSYKSHTYISGLEQGRVLVSITTLELLALLYHKMPKYLLGLEEAGLKSAVYFSVEDTYIDHCKYFILNSLFAPRLFDCPAKHTGEERLTYINAVIKLSCLPDCVIGKLTEIAKMIPALREVCGNSIPSNHKFYERLPGFRIELGQQYEDYTQQSKMLTAHAEIQSALDSLRNHNPNWLIWIAQVMAQRPDLILFTLYIVEQGGFISA